MKVPVLKLMPYLFFLLLVPLSLSAQLFPAAQDGKWGCVDAAGEWIVPPSYDYIEPFDERGLSRVLHKDKLGLIDTLGRQLLPCHYQLIQALSTGSFAVEEAGVLRLINQKQELLFDSLAFIPRYLGSGFFELRRGSKVQVGHRHSGLLSKELFSNLSHAYLDAGVVFVRQERKWGILDSAGQWVASPRFSSWESLPMANCFAAKDTAGYWLYRGDNLWQEQAWDSIEIIPGNSALLRLEKDTVSRLFDLQQQAFLGPNAEAFIYLNPGHYAYQQSGEWGIFTANSRTPCFAQRIEPLTPDLFRAVTEEGWGICNASGEWLLERRYVHISDFSDSLALAKRTSDSFDVVNTRGEILLSIPYGPLSLSNNTIERLVDGQLTRWSLEADGKSFERLNFNNLQRLRFGEKQKASTGPLQIRAVKRSQNFQLFKTAGDSTRPVSPPIYQEIYLPQGLPFYIGKLVNHSQLPPKERGRPSSLGLYGGVRHQMLYDLMHLQTGRRLLRLQELFIQDFQRMPLARCVLKDGSFALMDRSGKLVDKGYTFIRAPRQGYFIGIKKGKWEVSNAADVPTDTLGYIQQLNFGVHSQAVGSFDKAAQSWARIEGGEWNRLDSMGKAVFAQPLSYLGYFYQRQAIAKAQKWGILAEQGQWLLAPQYDGVSWVEGSLQSTAIFTKKIDQWGCLDTLGRVVLPSQFEALRPAKEGLFAVRQGNKWGFAEQQGHIRIPCTFLKVQDFSDGLAAVKTTQGWGYIRPDGGWQLSPRYKKAGDFSQGHAWVRQKAGVQLIDKRGNTVFEEDFYRGQTAGFGLFWLRNSKGWALYNSRGEVLFKRSKIQPKAFNTAGLARIRIKDKYFWVDTLGKSYRDKQAPLAVEKSHQNRLQKLYEDVSILASNKDGVLAHYRSPFKDPPYRLLSPHLHPLCSEGFDKAFLFEQGLARVRRGWSETIIHPAGIALQSFKYNQIKAFEQGYALTRLYLSKGIYHAPSQSILAEDLDYIECVAPGIFRVERGPELGYLRSNGSWIWPMQACW